MVIAADSLAQVLALKAATRIRAADGKYVDQVRKDD
jgi:hypothetical protein